MMKKAWLQPDAVETGDFAAHIADRPHGGPAVTVFGELDAATGPQLRKVIDRAVDSEQDVLIDLRACSFVDSFGIGVLAAAAVRLKEQRRSLLIRGAHERVRRIFEIAGLVAQDLIVLEPE